MKGGGRAFSYPEALYTAEEPETFVKVGGIWGRGKIHKEDFVRVRRCWLSNKAGSERLTKVEMLWYALQWRECLGMPYLGDAD